MSLSSHFPPELIHFLHNCLVPFSDQLLDIDPLLERDAGDTDFMPVELTVLEELLDFERRDAGLGCLEKLLGYEGVTLYAFPRRLDDRPPPCCRGLWCLGVPLDCALPDLEPQLFADLPLEVLDNILLPFVDVEREYLLGT